ncbi:MAG TPA: vanadium-dependent haloperoxidase [Chitinophagaceae bacterium]|nr:vanadium-dependent haloperoxidase [Chitinophagaceae bacterium]
MRRTLFPAIAATLLFCCCSKKSDHKILNDQYLLHQNMKQLTEVIIQDMFSPPVSSRIYCYTSLAAYEAVKFNKPGNNSITAQLMGFGTMPVPEKNKEYNFLLAATKAFFTVAEKITFSKDSLIQYENKLYPEFESLLDKETFDRSINFGAAVGKRVLERAATDNYKETRGMPKFIGSNEPGKWRPTATDYLDALEPNWAMIKPLAVNSEQCECPAPPGFSTDTTSEFFKYMKEVYDITTHLTDSQRTIAKYWDDNPFVIEHSGHLMYGNKKITPVGHWIGITGIACKKTKSDAVKTAEAYALTSIAMFDVINACWKMKYKYNHIRPITVINEYLDRNWQPFLQTPPFPEHSSGHSGISASAATVLTKLFGDNFVFEDTSDLEYIGMKRSFQSFKLAANEASISRVYGGIHYRTGVDAGAMQGREVGKYIIDKFLKEQAVKN